MGEADPGYLCVYGAVEASVALLGFYRPDSSTDKGASVDGTTVFFNKSSNTSWVRGTWAYTAAP
jgi:hypothetical protein